MKSEASPLIANFDYTQENAENDTKPKSATDKKFEWAGICIFGIFIVILIVIASLFGQSSNYHQSGVIDENVVEPTTNTQSPNIIYILMDDMGYSDISARGSEFETPNLDLLYENSIILNSHYIGLVCSPSRSQIITGRYAWNMGISDQTAFGSVQLAAFPAGLPTVGNLLNEYTNYETYFTGKWHMGDVTKYHLPLQRGFSKFYGFYTSNIKYSDKTIKSVTYDENYIDWRAMDEIDYDTQYDYSTFVTGDTMTDIISSHIDTYGTDGSKPFYLHVPFQALHATLEYVDSDNVANCDVIETDSTEEDEDEDDDTTSSNSNSNSKLVADEVDALELQMQISNDITADATSDDTYTTNRVLMCQNILAVDQVIGDLINNLKNEWNIWDDTLIIFTADNGASYKKGGCNYPLRGGKDTFYEGGIKTLAFVTGGYIDSSQVGTERDEFMHGVDWTPTILGLAGANVKQIENDLQTKLYVPASKSVSRNVYHNEDRYQDYLMESSFDGNDVSQWLLYGSQSSVSNDRTNVPLGINSVEDDHENDIGLVFTSSKTGHVYKLMYLSEQMTVTKNMEWCQYDDDSKQRYRDLLTSDEWVKTTQLLFDLTLEPNELTNLMTILDSDDDDSESENDIESNNDVSKKTVTISSYVYDNDLIQEVWNEGMEVVQNEMDNPMFNEFLNCQNGLLSEAADPSQFDGAYSPFYDWDTYVNKFESQCGKYVDNPLLKELFLTKYEDY